MEILWKVEMYTVNDRVGNTQEEGSIINEIINPEDSNELSYSKLSSPRKAPPRERALFEIADFEESRRLSNDSSMTRNELYWNELVKMQEEAFADNEQLLQYLRAKHNSILSFASSLDSLQTDHINRYPKRISKSTSISSADGQDGVGPQVTGSGNGGTPHNSSTIGPGHRARQELLSLDRVWAHRISAMAEAMEKDIITPFEQVKNEFVNDVTAMDRRCSNLFHAVRLADMRVQAYYAQIDDAATSPSRSAPMHRSKSHSSFGSITRSSSTTSLVPLQTCQSTEEPQKDMWLLDMCYRVAVVRHIQMKEECSRQLGRLLVRAREAESKRRDAIARATDQLANLQMDLWQHLTAIASSSIEPIHNRVAEATACPDMAAALRERVMLNQSQHGAPTSSSQHGAPQLQRQMSAPKEETKDYKEEHARLASPLESPMLSRCAVFLRRDGGTIVASWVPVLLFLTSDRYLHVFDLDPKCERMSEVAAFHTLVSASKKGLELSVSATGQGSVCEETEFDPKTSIQTLKSESFMTPTNSLSLSRCKVIFKPTVNDTTFEVVESVPNTGVGAMFKATFERRYVFRGRSQAEMVDWVLRLKGDR